MAEEPGGLGRGADGESPAPQRAPRRQWRDLHLWQIQPIRDALTVFFVFGVFYVGYLTSVVTVPLLVAMALAYLFEPLVRWANRRWRIRRTTMAVAIVMGGAFLVVVPVLLAIGFGGVQGLRAVQTTATNVDWVLKSVEKPDDPVLRAKSPGEAWDRVRDWIFEQDRRKKEAERIHAEDEARRVAAERRRMEEEKRLAEFAVRTSGDGRRWAWDDPDLVVGPQSVQTRMWDADLPPAVVAPKDAKPPPKPGLLYEGVMRGITWVKANAEQLGKQALSTGADAVGIAMHVVGAVGMTLFAGFLTAFFFFFFCTGFGEVLAFWESLIPERRKSRVLDLLDKMDRVIAGFIRGRLTICAMLMMYYTAAYLMIGVPGWILLGPVIGALALLPYISLTGAPIAMVLMWFDTSGTWQDAWWWTIAAPAAVSTIAQCCDDYVLTPRVQGRTTDMDTPSILFASLAGGALMGIYGFLIAIPLAACLKIVVREVVWPRFQDWASGKRKDFLPLEND